MLTTQPSAEPALASRAEFSGGEEPVLAPQNSTFDFRYVIAAIRINLVLIGVIIASTLAVAALITLLQTPRYTSTATLQINNTGSRVLSNRDEENSGDDTGGGAFDTDRFLKTQVDILKSRGLANRVAQKLKLMSNRHFYDAESESPPKQGLSEEEVRDMTLRLLQKNLKIDLPRESRIVSITFESTDPALATAVANAYATEFIQSNLQRKFDSSEYARAFVANQLTEVKQRLEESERSLNDYSREAGLIRVESQGSNSDGKSSSQTGVSVTSSSLMQLNEAANQALARRIDAEGRWNAINHGALLSSTEVVSNPAITGLLTQKAQLEGDLQQERSRHLDNYPTVIAKQQQLAALNQQLQNAAANIRNSLKSNYDAAVRTEKELLDKVDGLKSATLSEQDRSVKFGMLSREVDTNRQVYDGLLQRFKELNASAGISISNVSIVDVAARPLKPSSPDVVKNLLIAVVVSLALAAVTVFIKDQFDDSIRIPENVEDKLGIALLGVVPQVQDLVADAMIDPKSPVAEAYNSIRSSLMYSTRDGLPKVILFTSAQPSEGKSTSSVAISRGLARLGKRTLLVDADMRRPSLHRQIGSENAVGLSSLLVSDMPLQQAVVSGGEPDLFVITSGPVPPSPTELLSSGRFEHLLIEAARDYDVVIIDSPPVLGLADAPLMAALVDGVVFIVEADRSRHGSLKVALRRLRSMRPVLLGAVLTKFDPLKGGNRYSAYYGYEYYQYEYVDGKE